MKWLKVNSNSLYWRNVLCSSSLNVRSFPFTSYLNCRESFLQSTYINSSAFSTSSNSNRQVNVILPSSEFFYSGQPEYYETIAFFDDIYIIFNSNSSTDNFSDIGTSQKAIEETSKSSVAANFQVENDINSKKKSKRNYSRKLKTMLENYRSNILEHSINGKDDFNTVGFNNVWKTEKDMSTLIGYPLSNYQYQTIIGKLDLLQSLPASPLLTSFLQGFKKEQHIVNHPHPLHRMSLNLDGLLDHNNKESFSMINDSNYNKQFKSIYSVGKRKTSSAQVWLFPKHIQENSNINPSDEFDLLSVRPGSVLVNGKLVSDYFQRFKDLYSICKPFEVTNRFEHYNIWCRVHGGGTTGKSEAIALGIARALALVEPELRVLLDQYGLLIRDPRTVERKKPGKEKARKSFSWVKR